MSSKEPIKIRWSWEEWQLSRAARREASVKVGPPITRRRESSSDKRLRAAFNGKRGPEFKNDNSTT